jgi:hypothetical protein
MKRLAAVLLLTGCASATATIAAEANDVRSSAASARRHLDAARADLDEIEASAAQVHSSLTYVSDDESPVWRTMLALSVAVGVCAVAAVVYKFKR